MKMKTGQILFVCTGNSCRSVMAEGFFNKIARERGLPVRAISCGTSAFAGSGASMETIRVMKGEGVDVASHRGQRISRELINECDWVVVMQELHGDFVREFFPAARDKIKLLTEFYSGEDKKDFLFGIPDPIGMSGDFYRNVFEVIRKSVEGLVDWLGAKKAP